jgi:hypothetical protein
MNRTPLSQDEYIKLFRALELISANVARLLTAGVVEESLDDGQIQSSQRKIEKHRESIHREQDRIRKLRDYIRRKKQIDQRRKQNTSEY